MEIVNSYKDLLIWQKGIEIAKLTYALLKKFPEDEKFGLANQIRRCAYSIPMNIAEGWGRNSTKNFIHFLNISRGSLLELETIFILVKDLSFSINDILSSILEIELSQESKMINSFINSLERKLN